jgi:hypothetical protein
LPEPEPWPDIVRATTLLLAPTNRKPQVISAGTD